MTRDEATQSGRVVTMPIERYQRYQEAERQVAAAREVLQWLENGPLFITRQAHGMAAELLYRKIAKVLRRALEAE